MAAKAQFREKDQAWYVYINHHGRRTARKIGPGREHKAEAKRLEAQINAKLAEEGFRLPNKALTFDTLATDWLSSYPAKKSIATKTLANYRWLVTQHLLPYFRSTPIVSITPEAIEQFITEKKAGTATVPKLGTGSLRIAFMILTLLFDRAVRDDVITKNPARMAEITVHRPDPDDRVDPFEPAELVTIIRAARQLDPLFATFLTTWAQTGTRLGEVSAIQHRDLDLRKGTVSIHKSYSPCHLDGADYTVGPTKTRRNRIVNLTHPVLEDTSEWRPNVTDHSRRLLRDLAQLPTRQLGPEAYVFSADGAKPCHPHTVSYRWGKALKAANVRHRNPEQLRHTFASHLLSRNAPPLYVQDQGGWKSAAVLMRVYSKWMSSTLPTLPDFDERDIEESITTQAQAQPQEPVTARVNA